MDATAKRLGRVSVGNSFLLPATAAFQLNQTFWVLVVTNFLLMHAIWVTPLVRYGTSKGIDFRPVKWPLIAFGVLGNLALLTWGNQLLSVFQR